MAKIPKQSEDALTVRKIYEAYEQRNSKARQSRRLGASTIGKECERALWYGFRHCKPVGLTFNGRMLRLFETGHLEEPRMGSDLQAIGCDVHLGDAETGEQYEFTDIAGHFVCKIDGAAVGVPEAPKAWHVLEFKTHNARSFGALKKKGVKEAKPEHYAQCVRGMALSKMPRALYLAKNKDTDELYAERLKWEECREDDAVFRQKAERIVNAATPPERVSDDRDSFLCKFCDFNSACHGSDPPNAAVPVSVTCRSCVHATPEMDTDSGRWSCSKHGMTLTDAKQLIGCADHLLIPALVTFADVVDAGYADDGDWTEYCNHSDGAVWRNTKAKGGYSSAELALLPGPLVAAGLVGDAKEVFEGAEVVGVKS